MNLHGTSILYSCTVQRPRAQGPGQNMLTSTNTDVTRNGADWILHFISSREWRIDRVRILKPQLFLLLQLLVPTVKAASTVLRRQVAAFFPHPVLYVQVIISLSPVAGIYPSAASALTLTLTLLSPHPSNTQAIASSHFSLLHVSFSFPNLIILTST
jgi:hypothetical protein